MGRQLEFRLDAEAVRPLIERTRLAIDGTEDQLAAPNGPPVDDDLMTDFWQSDLLGSQQSDMAALTNLFDDTFLDTGRARVDEEDVDRVLRGCAAARLKLRELCLNRFEDESLERGELERDDLSEEETEAYGAYILFASLQELIISQMDP